MLIVRPRLSIFVFLEKADGIPVSKTLKDPMVLQQKKNVNIV